MFSAPFRSVLEVPVVLVQPAKSPAVTIRWPILGHLANKPREYKDCHPIQYSDCPRRPMIYVLYD